MATKLLKRARFSGVITDRAFPEFPNSPCTTSGVRLIDRINMAMAVRGNVSALLVDERGIVL